MRVEDLKLLYDELLCEAGVEILFYNRVIDAVVEENNSKNTKNITVSMCPDAKMPHL